MRADGWSRPCHACPLLAAFRNGRSFRRGAASRSRTCRKPYRVISASPCAGASDAAICADVRSAMRFFALDPFTVAGFVGVAAIVTAYFANQQGWLSAEDWRFPAANLVGSLLILASLWTAWNFPSAVIEVVWAAISLYGLSRHLRRR